MKFDQDFVKLRKYKLILSLSHNRIKMQKQTNWNMYTIQKGYEILSDHDVFSTGKERRTLSTVSDNLCHVELKSIYRDIPQTPIDICNYVLVVCHLNLIRNLKWLYHSILYKVKTYIMCNFVHCSLSVPLPQYQAVVG